MGSSTWTKKLGSRTNGYTESAETGTEENLGLRDRRLDWIVTEIGTGASDAETGGKEIQEQASSRTKRSRLKQEGQRKKGLAAFGVQKAGYRLELWDSLKWSRSSESHWEEEGAGDDSWKLGERGSVEFMTGEGTFHP